MKTYIIGDIHGNIKALNELLEKIDLSEVGSKIIFLGDYIDRGADSFAVVKKVQNLQSEYGLDRIIALKGNHEDMLLKSLENGIHSYATQLFLSNGGQKTLLSYEKANADIMADYDWFKNLPLYYEGKTFIAVHGGLRGGVELSEQTTQDLLWIREDFHELPEGTFDKTVIFGHTITGYLEEGNEHTPVLLENGCIGIDTGAVFTNVLTAVVIENEEELTEFIQNR